MGEGFQYSITAYSNFTERFISETPLPRLSRQEVNVFGQEVTNTAPYLYDTYPISSGDSEKIELVQKHLPEFEFDFSRCDYFFEVTVF